MEVAPEIYAWLTSLNIIDIFKSLAEDSSSNFIIPEETLNLLFGGKYMDIILTNLQDAYNKCYKSNTDYITKINQIKPIEQTQSYISNSVKYANWQIIVEILGNFGLSYSEKEINLIVNKDKEQLKKILSNIYDMLTKFIRNSTNENNNINTNVSITNKGNTKKITKKHIISIANKNVEQTKESKIESTDNNNRTNKTNININNKNNVNKNISNISKIKDEPLNINLLNPSKSYSESSSILEFFILSICKNMKMKPRQSVALLSNNRKYLSIVCHKGFNNDFSILKNWLTDLYNNKDIMIELIQNSGDGMNICYGIIGTAIKCNDHEISLQAAKLLYLIHSKIGMNWDWFLNEGIKIFIFILIKNDKYKLELLKILYDFIKDDTSYFFDEIRKILETDKKIIFDFLSNIISVANNINNDFSIDFQNLIFDICLKMQIDHSYNLAMLSDTFYYFNPIEEDIINKIILYFRECIRSKTQNVFSTAIFHIFILMERLGKIKNKYAPQLYKNIVFLFLEEYDNEIKREIILESFEQFFNNNHDVPIDILLEPYLNQLNTCHNFALCDFLFLLKIVEHPRIENKDLSQIIQFILNVCLNNVMFSRCANLILSLILEKKLIVKNTDNVYEIDEIENKLIDFIKTALDSYITNLSKEEDKFILETPYDIIAEDFSNLNIKVKDSLINSIKVYRKLKGTHSNCLLAMLWFYSDSDDIMCQIEEINRPIYEPLEEYNERRRKEQEERDKKDYTKKVINSLSKMREEKLNILFSREKLIEQKKIREERIKKRLAERRKIKSAISSIDEPPKAPILLASTKLKRTNSDFYNIKLKKKIQINPNNIPTGHLKSNMLFAMKNATQKYMNKGIIQENSKLYSQKSSSTNFQQKIVLKRNRSQISIIHNKKRSNIINKYPIIMGDNQVKIVKEGEGESVKNYRSFQKMEKSKVFVQKERRYVNSSQVISLNELVRYNIENYIIFDKIVGLPFDLDDEEDRELKAINGYNDEYKNNLKFYFKSYGNELKDTIPKSKFLKMLRDRGIDSERMDYEEMNIIVKRLFGDNLIEFDFNQFVNLLVQLSYLIYTKRRPTLTIGETYGILLKRFSLNDNTQKVALLKRQYEPVINYLLELKEDKDSFVMPEGFQIVKKTNVKYNSRLAPHFLDILGEGKYVCYQILEDILFHIFNSSIIEPYVEVFDGETVDIDPEKIRNWSPELTMAYIDLDKKYKLEGMFAADAIEDGIRKLFKKGILKEKDDDKNNLKNQNKVKMTWARKDIQKKMEQYKQLKIQQHKKRMQNRIDIFKVSNEEKKKIQLKFKYVKEVRERKEKERKDKILYEQQKKKEKEEKKMKIWMEYYNKQKRVLKEQFKTIITKRKALIKSEEEKKELELQKIKEYKDKSLSDKDKNYFIFEKNLNNTMKELISRKEIKEIFDKYNNHLKLIYDIYSKFSVKKIEQNAKEAIKMDGFKQFLANFAILGEVVSVEQMIWIFNNIAKILQNEKNNQIYLDFDDFKLSLCYLAIFNKIRNKDKKILPKDIEEINVENIENFMKLLGLKLPYSRIEIEKFINERRNMTYKNLINVQHKMKIDTLNELAKNSENFRKFEYKKSNDSINYKHFQKDNNINMSYINSKKNKNVTYHIRYNKITKSSSTREIKNSKKVNHINNNKIVIKNNSQNNSPKKNISDNKYKNNEKKEEVKKASQIKLDNTKNIEKEKKDNQIKIDNKKQSEKDDKGSQIKKENIKQPVKNDKDNEIKKNNIKQPEKDDKGLQVKIDNKKLPEKDDNNKDNEIEINYIKKADNSNNINQINNINNNKIII